MDPKFKQFFLDMLNDLAVCMSMNQPLKTKAEKCFWIAHDHWKELVYNKNLLDFCNDHEEIEFFKFVKPNFTSYQEYFILLYESLLFVPKDKENAICFWQDELKQYERFCNKHRYFISYYQTGKRKLDKVYFLRQNCQTNLECACSIYDINTMYRTSHDSLIRSFLARKRYWQFVRETIKDLEVYNTSLSFS